MRCKAKLHEVATAKETRDKLADEVAELRRHKQLLDDLSVSYHSDFRNSHLSGRECNRSFCARNLSLRRSLAWNRDCRKTGKTLFVHKTTAVEGEIAAKLGNPKVTEPPIVGTAARTIADWDRRVEVLEREIQLDSAMKKTDP